jgi:hypothetical protein
MNVREVIEQLTEEDPERLIRSILIFFKDHDRFSATNNRITKSKAVKEKKDKLKDKI